MAHPHVQQFVLSRLRRFDHWLLLRAPLFWRTQPLRFLVVPGFVLLLIWLVQSIDGQDPLAIDASWLRNWWILLMVASLVVWHWVKRIVRWPVGEILFRRHLTTIVTVAIGSYLWLVAPGILVYQESTAVAAVPFSDPQLAEDLATLSKHEHWRCIPPEIWDDSAARATAYKQLQRVISRYTRDRYDSFETAKSPSYHSCRTDRYHALQETYMVSQIEENIALIRAARRFWVRGKSDNPYSTVRDSFIWLIFVAIAAGFAAALLSYPHWRWLARAEQVASKLP